MQALTTPPTVVPVKTGTQGRGGRVGPSPRSADHPDTHPSSATLSPSRHSCLPLVIPAKAGIQRGGEAGHPHNQPPSQSPTPSASIPAEAGIHGRGTPTTNLRRIANTPHPSCPHIREPHPQRPAHLHPDTSPSRKHPSIRYPPPMTCVPIHHQNGVPRLRERVALLQNFLTHSRFATPSLQNRGQTTSPPATDITQRMSNQWQGEGPGRRPTPQPTTVAIPHLCHLHPGESRDPGAGKPAWAMSGQRELPHPPSSDTRTHHLRHPCPPPVIPAKAGIQRGGGEGHPRMNHPITPNPATTTLPESPT